MRTTFGLLFLLLLTFPNSAMATETKQTQSEQSKWLVKSLSNHLLEIKENKGKAQIISDGQYSKDSSRESKFTLAPGESFHGPSDHHASTSLRMVAIDSESLKLTYEMRFDHRSFGKDLVTIDKGTVAVPLKATQASSTKSVLPQKSSIATQFENLRHQIPEAQTISEQNGVSIPDAKGVYYTCTRLARAASNLNLDTATDALSALKYLDDADYKLRFIAASALSSTLKTHPHGLSMSDIEDRSSAGHEQLVAAFKVAIRKHYATKEKTLEKGM
ncbi:MAG: hypothetical protein WCT03_23150 [Candidatus Obscuribacterales bacterium]|jgi:hypothetical protein